MTIIKLTIPKYRSGDKITGRYGDKAVKPGLSYNQPNVENNGVTFKPIWPFKIETN